MPFGLKNATQTFQRYMDSIFRDVDFVYCYIDDIIVMSETPQKHLQHLCIIFEKLRQHGLTINANKCVFGHPEVQFLGYSINQHGIAPPTERISAVSNYPKPQTIQDSIVLAHPSSNVPLALVTDASDVALGAALEQQVANAWQPLGFFSRKLSKAESKYSTYDRELLAIYEAIRHFRHLLDARHFVVKNGPKNNSFTPFSKKWKEHRLDS